MSSTGTDGRTRSSGSVVSVRFRDSLQRVAFWGAIVLPFSTIAYAATGVGPLHFETVAVLLALNVLAVVAGHGYGR